MIPIIIVTKNPPLALKQLFDIDLSQPAIDHLIISSESSIGIKQVRGIHQFTHQKPHQLPHKFIIIPHAESITQVAQHALLKSLEEAPDFIQHLLCTPTKDTLLPTILSRCLITHHHQKQSFNFDSQYQPLIQELPSASIATKIELAQTFGSKKDQALDTVTQLIHYYRSENLNSPSKDTTQTLKNLGQAYKHLQQNSNPQLTLEHLFFISQW